MNLEERIAVFRARTEQYRRLGYDRFAAARFVAEAAGRLEGPALDVARGRACSPWLWPGVTSTWSLWT